MGTVHEAVPFEYPKVAPDGLRSDPQLGGELRDVDRTIGPRRNQDLVLTLLRLHAAHLCPTGPRITCSVTNF